MAHLVVDEKKENNNKIGENSTLKKCKLAFMEFFMLEKA
jgi:hypothetical protein